MADSNKAVPGKSTLLNCAFENSCLKARGLWADDGRPWNGKFLGMLNSRRPIETRPAGMLCERSAYKSPWSSILDLLE